MDEAALDSLFEWQSIAQFSSAADALQDELGFGLWTERLGKRVQEALSLSIFSQALGASECRLVRDDPPDGEIRDNSGAIRRVEVTIAFTKGRRVVDEYRAEMLAPSGIRHISQGEMAQADRTWTDLVMERVARKFERRPQPKFDDLLVYNNIGELFGTPGWEALPDRISAVVPSDWEGRVWQHRASHVDMLWPKAMRFPLPIPKRGARRLTSPRRAH